MSCVCLLVMNYVLGRDLAAYVVCGRLLVEYPIKKENNLNSGWDLVV